VTFRFVSSIALLQLGLFFACGGKSKPPAEPPSLAPGPLDNAGSPASELSLSDLEPAPSTPPTDFPPPPLIRVGLTTRAEAVRLTSSVPLKIRVGSLWIDSHDVLVERQVDGVLEGRVYRLQVGSFLTRSGAEDILTSLKEEVETSGRISREPITGRFAVRVGSFATASGANETRRQLTRLGFETARVVVEPSSSYRPTSLWLRRAGAEAVRTDEMVLLVHPGTRGAWIEVDGSPYRGAIEISVNASNRFTIVNILNLEDYLKGVVPAELSPAVYPQLEAIKAQAVAARTYAIRHLGQFEAEGYDICATPACQVYRGVAVEQRMGNEAVAATRGQVLSFEGKPIDALYTSTCGGHTENVENVFNGPPLAYLVSRPCFSEAPGLRLVSSEVPPTSLEVAGAVVLGLVEAGEVEGGSLNEPATASEFSRWAGRSIARLGQSQCRALMEGQTAVTELAFTRELAGSLCWEGRLPFLLSVRDMERLVPAAETPGLTESERRALAYWIREQWIHPPPDGLNPERVLTRQEVLESLYRLVASRGDAPLTEATVVGVDAERGQIVVRTAETEQTFSLGARRFLFRKTNDKVYFTPALSILSGDRILFHRGGGVDLIVLASLGVDFDRSSRFSRWTVRKTNQELTRAMNEGRRLGNIIDLRPKRYGVSGRVAELEVVGAERTIVLTGLAIRRSLGIRENLFFIDKQRTRNGDVEAWVLTGGGWGHGVGLCQVGAYGMAMAGYDYLAILSHFYPGTQVTRATSLDKLSLLP